MIDWMGNRVKIAGMKEVKEVRGEELRRLRAAKEGP